MIPATRRAFELRLSEVTIAHEPVDLTAGNVRGVFNTLRSGRPGTLGVRADPARGAHGENDPAEWQLTIEDSSWIATVSAESHALRGATYCAPLSALRAGVIALSLALERNIETVRRTNLSLRYTHQLDCGPDFEAYRRTLRKHIFERCMDTRDARGELLWFPLDERVSARCTYGFVRSSSVSDEIVYRVDATTVRPGAPPFDVATTLAMLDEMHRMHLDLLRTCVVDET